MSLTTRKMSDRHEEHLADVLDGVKTKASGSTWADPSDGHQTASEGFWRFAWDGKSTLGKSIGVTREMWAKIEEQSRGLIPMVPLRWYGDQRLTRVDLDLVVIDLDTFAQMQADANRYRAMNDVGCASGNHEHQHDDGTYGPCRGCGLHTYEVGS